VESATSNEEGMAVADEDIARHKGETTMGKRATRLPSEAAVRRSQGKQTERFVPGIGRGYERSEVSAFISGRARRRTVEKLRVWSVMDLAEGDWRDYPPAEAPNLGCYTFKGSKKACDALNRAEQAAGRSYEPRGSGWVWLCQ